MAERLFTDPALRDAYRALMRDNPGGHIDEATWDRIVATEIDPAERETAFDHVVTCDRCSRIWRGVLALQEEARNQGLLDRETTPTSWRARRSLGEGGWRGRLVPLAAAAILIVAISGLLISRRAPDADAVRSTTALATVDGLMMSYSAEGVPVFIWAPVRAATGYRVELFTDDGRPVWARDVEAPPLRWPADAPRTTGAFRWRVVANGSSGVVAQSPLTAVEISR